MKKTKPRRRWKAWCPRAGTWITLPMKRTDKFCPNCRAVSETVEVEWRLVLCEEARDGE